MYILNKTLPRLCKVGVLKISFRGLEAVAKGFSIGNGKLWTGGVTNSTEWSAFFMERTGGVSGKVCLIMNRPIVPLKPVECWGTSVLSEQLVC